MREFGSGWGYRWGLARKLNRLAYDGMAMLCRYAQRSHEFSMLEVRIDMLKEVTNLVWSRSGCRANRILCGGDRVSWRRMQKIWCQLAQWSFAPYIKW